MLRVASNNQVREKNANVYLVGDPQVTFFKSVYKRHSNFAKESFTIQMRNKNQIKKTSSTLIVCEIPKYGDLLGKIYLKVTIPPMKTSDEQKFVFNDHLGYSIIENIKLKINDIVVDTIDSEMLYIMNQLSNTDEKRSMVDSLINPNQGKEYLYTDTTTSTSGSKTFINRYFNSPIYTEKQTLFIPLDFSFTNYSKTFLPLFLLENKSIKVEILLRGTDSLYTIEKFDKNYWYYEKIPDMSVSGYPVISGVKVTGVSGYTSRKLALDNTSTEEVSDPLTFGQQTTFKATATSPFYLKRYESRKRSVPIDASEDINKFTYTSDRFDFESSLEVEQIFLTEEEKQELSSKTNKYIVQHIHKNELLGVRGNQTMSWYIDNHFNLVKELYITVSRNDNKNRNELLNFSNYETSDITEEIITKYQDNWWYDSITSSSTPETLTNVAGDIVIIPDRFQEFLFRYGPYGEAQNENALGISGWPNKIEPQYIAYSIEEIDTFRKTWRFRAAADIPLINKDNFNSTFKQSPLQKLEILFDGIQRESVKDTIFFNQIQPYNYHTNSVDKGVYIYSFSLEPEKFQPSGFCNMNLFNRVQYKFTISDTENKPDSEFTTFSNNFYNINKDSRTKTVLNSSPPLYFWKTNPNNRYTTKSALRVESDIEAKTKFNSKQYEYDIRLYNVNYNFITIKDQLMIPAFNVKQ